GRRGGVPGKSKIARRKNARASCRNPHGDVCMDARSRRQHRRIMEGEEIIWRAWLSALFEKRRLPMFRMNRQRIVSMMFLAAILAVGITVAARQEKTAEKPAAT